MLKKNKVVALISTLSKGEKRNFTLFAKRNQGKSYLFLSMFQIYDNLGQISDNQLLELLPELKKSQIHNVRSHLYTQILRSLRQLHLKHEIEIEIREKIDFAHVLNSKGFYKEALDILQKIKHTAISQNRNVIALEILFFERSIELQNITQSIENRAFELVEETNHLANTIDQIKFFSTIDLELYTYYLQQGFCRSKKEIKRFDEQFSQRLLSKPSSTDNFYSFLYYYQSKTWYYYIKQDFEECKEYSLKWTQLFDRHEHMKELRPSLYYKAIHNVINSSFLVNDFDSFQQYLSLLQSIETRQLKRHEKSMKTLYEQMHSLDYSFFTGQFEAYNQVGELTHLINENPFGWDNHRLAVFRYKLGCLFFGLNDYETAAEHFFLVGQFFSMKSKSPIYIFSKILLCLSHYNLRNLRLVASQVKALQNQLSKFKSSKKLEKLLVRMISRLISAPVNEQQLIFEKAKAELIEFQQQKYANIGFRHFFAIEWIEGQLTNQKACTIIANSFQQKQLKSSTFADYE